MRVFDKIEESVLRYLISRKSAPDDDWYRLGRAAAAEAACINRRFEQLKVRANIDTDRIIASDTGNFIRYPLRAFGKIADINSVIKDLETAVSTHRRTETSIHLRRPMLALEMAYPLETNPLTWATAKHRLDALRPFQALLGMDYTATDPQPAILDFGSKIVASGMIAGATGSGKTTLIANMAVSLCHSTTPRDLQIVFCDPKFDDDYFALAQMPHVTMVNEPDDCIRAIYAVKDELEKRKRSPSKSRVVLFIDEYADLKGSQDDDGDALSRAMASITAIGRSKGIHVVLATQKPTTEIVDTVAKGNLTVRLGGAVMTPKESEIVMGRGGVGCESLEGKGAFYAILGGGRVIRTQSYLLDGEILENATRAVANKWSSVEPMRIDMDGIEIAMPSATDDAIDAVMIEQVMTAMEFGEMFKADGSKVRGARAEVLRILFDGAPDKGTPGRTVDRILDKIWAIRDA